jgi:hypothetical protein
MCLLPWALSYQTAEDQQAALNLAQMVLSQPPLCQQALHQLQGLQGLQAQQFDPQLDHGVPAGHDPTAAAADMAAAAAAAAGEQGPPVSQHLVAQQLQSLLLELQQQQGGGDMMAALKEHRSTIAALLLDAHSAAAEVLVSAAPQEGGVGDQQQQEQQQQQQQEPADAAAYLKQVYGVLTELLGCYFAKDVPRDLIPPAALIMPPKVATGRAAAGAGKPRDFNLTNIALSEVPGLYVEVEGVRYQLYYTSTLRKPSGGAGGGGSSSDLQLPPAAPLEAPGDTAAPAPVADAAGAATGLLGGPAHAHMPAASSSGLPVPALFQMPDWQQVQQQQQVQPQYMMVPAALPQLPVRSPFASTLSQLDIPAAAAAAAGSGGMSPAWALAQQQQQQQQQPTSPSAPAGGLEDRFRMCALAIRPSKGVPVSGQSEAPGAVSLPDAAWLQPMNNSKLGTDKPSGANSSSSKQPEGPGVGEVTDKTIRLFCLGLLIYGPQRKVVRHRSNSGTLKRTRSISAPGTSQPPPGDAMS